MNKPEQKVIKFPVKANNRVYKKSIRTNGAADPIKDLQTRNAIMQKLGEGKYGTRNKMIFILGVSSGRRCGDLLNMQRKEVWDDVGNCVSNCVRYLDKKTSRYMNFYLPEYVRNALQQYIIESGINNPKDYIFPSRKENKKGTPVLDVRSYCRILRNIKKDLNLDIRLSTHSMRKTFGYVSFRQFGADFTTAALGHYSMKNTARYIGLDQEYLQEKYQSLDIFGDDSTK